ncbi:MAG: hypothetical protein R3A48_26385 [Polyangiales bacterium]
MTSALQAIAKKNKSRQAEVWGVFPVFGRELVVVGFLTARTPKALPHAFAIEPGGDLAMTHDVVSYQATLGYAVGRADSERLDADCVDAFAQDLAANDAWAALGASPVALATLPGGESLDALDTAAHLLLTDDGRGADVVYGMSFWRAGDTYREGRVDTWTRAVDGDGAVRVVGISLARVDAETPLRVAPTSQGEAIDALKTEVRAVLDSPRPFDTYFIADAK